MCIRDSVESLIVENGRADRQHDVGKDDASHEINLVPFQELVSRLLGDIGTLLIVGNDDLGRQAAQLAVELLDGQVEAVADIDAEPSTRPGKRRNETDLDLVGSVNGTGKQQSGGKGSQAT